MALDRVVELLRPGGTLVLAQVGTFAEGMSAGRGFIAIAVVVLGRWHPVGVAGALFDEDIEPWDGTSDMTIAAADGLAVRMPSDRRAKPAPPIITPTNVAPVTT